LSQLGFNVVGLDLHPHPFWARIPAAKFVVSTEGDTLPFEDDIFDLCIHFQALMYFKDPERHLGEIHRVLKRGGYVSLQVTNRCCLRNLFAGTFGDTDFFRLYSQEELISLLEQSGFRLEKTFCEMFYAPIFPLFINFLRRVLLARDFDMFDRDSLFVRLTPPRYRGVVNVVVRKI
jgi:SAM-dependent methyltransferase